jgi:uncharacterized protein DUF4238
MNQEVKQPEKFDVVRHSHVVPAGYLRNFADDQDMIDMQLIKGPRKKISVRDAAIRKNFYSRERPATGERIDDVEWSLQMLENLAIPILANAEDSWPLSRAEKETLAEFFAMQLVRSPRWAEGYLERTQHFISEQREKGTFEELAQPGGPDAETRAKRHEEYFAGDTQRLIRMMSLSPKGAAILGSMSWTLIRFRSPVIAISDHPISLWLINERAKKPSATVFGAGLLNAREAWVPLSPTSVILMAWLDEPEDRPAMRGHRHHARAINSFTIANAEKQWFCLPGSRPTTTTGALLPLSSELLEGYSAEQAATSRIRNEISRRVQPRIGTTLPQTYEIVRLHDPPLIPLKRGQ